MGRRVREPVRACGTVKPRVRIAETSSDQIRPTLDGELPTAVPHGRAAPRGAGEGFPATGTITVRRVPVATGGTPRGAGSVRALEARSRRHQG